MDLIMPVHHKAKIFAKHMQSIQHRSEESMRPFARGSGIQSWMLRES
jgi:hypothetical protein